MLENKWNEVARRQMDGVQCGIDSLKIISYLVEHVMRKGGGNGEETEKKEGKEKERKRARGKMKEMKK